MKYDFEQYGLTNSSNEFGGFEIAVDYLDCENWEERTSRYELYSFKNALNHALECTKYDDVVKVHIVNMQTGELHYLYENGGMSYYSKP